eukprot:4160680-Pyramimonas_sp.AAC.1
MVQVFEDRAFQKHSKSWKRTQPNAVVTNAAVSLVFVGLPSGGTNYARSMPKLGGAHADHAIEAVGGIPDEGRETIQPDAVAHAAGQVGRRKGRSL